MSSLIWNALWILPFIATICGFSLLAQARRRPEPRLVRVSKICPQRPRVPVDPAR